MQARISRRAFRGLMAMADKKPIPFANWEPDRSEFNTPQQIKGVLSTGGTYGPWPSLAKYRGGLALNDRALGARTFYTTTGQAHTFIGDRTKLYKVNGGIPTDVSKSGGYTADQDWSWTFEQFGNNVIATARGVSKPQLYVLGSSSVFADLGGDPPASDGMGRIREWLWLSQGRTVSVSGFNDITDWSYDPANQGFQSDRPQEAGLIVNIAGGEQGAIFRERGIERVAFTGGSIPFMIDEIEGGRGLASPNGRCKFGRMDYCVAEDGFYRFNGLEAEPLGASRVDEWFTERLNYSYRHRITTAFDARRKTWIIAYPTEGKTSCNEILAYNIADNRWTYTELETQLLFEMPYQGVSADDAAGIVSLVGTDIADDIDVSVDSPLWRESRRQWAAVDTGRSISLFTGAPQAAQLETSTFEPVPGQQSYVSEIWPVTDAAPEDVTGTIITRQHNQSQAEAEDSGQMIEEGFCPVRAEGRYLRARIAIASGAEWTEAAGIHTDGSASGGR